MDETEWEQIALEKAQESLQPEMAVYAFQVHFQKNEIKIQVLLDKLSDKYGSPNVEDCELFSRNYSSRLQQLTEEGKLPENYSLEVSSAGAEREIRYPQDMERFRSYPMKVQYIGDNDKIISRVFTFVETKGSTTYWQSVETKLQRKQKLQQKAGQKKGKKAKVEMFEIEKNKIQRINLYLDF